jgi:hypothetical protein
LAIEEGPEGFWLGGHPCLRLGEWITIALVKIAALIAGVTLLATAGLAPPALAARKAFKPSNGQYAYVTQGNSPPGSPAISFNAQVRNNVITAATYGQQPWTAAVGVTWTVPGMPATTTFGRTRISRRGTFTLGKVTASNGQGSPASGVCLSGKTTKKGLSMSACAGLSDFNGGPVFLAAKRATNIPTGQYTGNSSSVQAVDPDGPYGPQMGAVGSITLNATGPGGQATSVSGTGTFAPIDPNTGQATGGPPVTVSYASWTIASQTTGLFSVASTPPGYDLCGQFVSGAGQGAVGLVACQQSSYLPATFVLSVNS